MKNQKTYEFNIIPFINFCALQNFPYIEEDFDALTDYQIMSLIAGKLKEVIKQVNNNTEFLKNISVNFDSINNEISLIKESITDLQNQINNVYQRTIDEVDRKLLEQTNNITRLLNNYEISINARLNELEANLNKRIDDIEVGAVNVFNPTNGLTEPVNKVIQDIYNVSRYEAINCTEFDNLELTATDYDNKEITASNFDNYSKTILMP